MPSLLPRRFGHQKERQEKQPQNRTAEGNWSATGSGHHHALPSCVFLKSWLATVLALPLRRYPGATTALQVTVELAASARSISNHTFAVWCDVAQLPPRLRSSAGQIVCGRSTCKLPFQPAHMSMREAPPHLAHALQLHPPRVL